MDPDGKTVATVAGPSTQENPEVSRETMAVVYAAEDVIPGPERDEGNDEVRQKFPSCDPLGLETIVVQDPATKTGAQLFNQDNGAIDRSQALAYQFKDGLHTFSVPVKDHSASTLDEEGRDPTFTLSSVSFELAPVAVTQDPDTGKITQEFSIVPAGTLPLSHSGASAADLTNTRTIKAGKKKRDKKAAVLKRTGNDVAVTELSLPKRIKVEEEHLEMACEWADCDFQTDNMNAFMAHVSSHVDNDVPLTDEGGEEEEVEGSSSGVKPKQPPDQQLFGCLWQDCDHQTPSSGEIVRHIHFHTYHTKLKSRGKNVLTATGIEPCKMDARLRNRLPDLSEPFVCLWEGCTEPPVFSQATLFYWHTQWHSEEFRGEKEIKCKWKDCSTMTKSVAKLREHVRVHSQERVVGCPVCGGLFANRSKFFDHCKRQEDSSHLSLKCSYCNKTFAIERLLRDHMRAHINQFKCPLCDMTCPQPSNLVSHMSYRHFQVRSFQCNECPYKGKTSDCLQKHYRNVHVQPAAATYECPYEGCKWVGKTKAGAKAHIDRVHEKVSKYECHLCEKRFLRGAYLTQHLTSVHKLRWPSGHTRFRYRRDDATGIFTLQTIRLESTELIEKETESQEDGGGADDVIMQHDVLGDVIEEDSEAF